MSRGPKWSAGEQALFQKMYDEGYTFAHIAETLEWHGYPPRSPLALRSRRYNSDMEPRPNHPVRPSIERVE